MLPYGILRSSLHEAGLSLAGFIGEASLRAACGSLPPSLSARLGLDAARGAVAAALAYGEGEGLGPAPAWPPRGGSLARIARFARANWYAELAARLKDAASRTRARLADAGLEAPAAREWRFFVNSRLPEKRLALEAGIGRLGRHTLLMAEGPGSAVVLGILLLPLPLADPPPTPTAVGPALDPSCESCGAGGGAGGGACVEACPTGALRGDGTLDRELCLQHWSSVPGPLPAPVEAAWGDRLYGCDLCQEACPRFRPDPTVATSRGVLGPGLSASWLAGASDSEIRASLRGSALGMGWIPPEALRRNASLALRGI